MTLDFGVLGPLQMSVDGAPVPLGTPKQRAVLAMLVMSRNRPVSSDSLVNAAWEQFPPPEPKANLHSYVSNLRRLVAGAGLDCAKSVQPGGPEAARYSIFADKDQLILHFNESIKQNDEVLRCPGADADSPIDWNYKATPDAVAGQVACGTYQGNADVMWTQYDELLLADVQSTNMDDLHNWWLNYS
jgi:hypothetical protein